jgi:hypothetical protein
MTTFPPDDWHRREAIPTAWVCALLSYNAETVHKMIKVGLLEGRGKGSGQRVTVASVKRFLAGETTWLVSERLATKKPG